LLTYILQAKAAMEKEVEARVKALLAEPKASGKKFEDPDFGPTTDDEYGAKVCCSIYCRLPVMLHQAFRSDFYLLGRDINCQKMCCTAAE
jgi:hypothetical protein